MTHYQGMSLETAITLYPRVYATYGTHGEGEIMIERFYVPRQEPVEMFLNACHFTLVVISPIMYQEIESSLVCTSYQSLVQELITSVLSGYELSQGKHWFSTPRSE